MMEDPESTCALLGRVLQLLRTTKVIDVPRKQSVVKFFYPEELQNNLDLSLTDNSLNGQRFEDLLTKIISYSVKTSHPYFFNQLYGGVDPYGLAGAWITEALNTSQYTFEVAPVFTLIEQIVLEKILHLIGYNDGDGIFAPGGSISNMYAMVLARFRAVPNIKTRGMNGIKLVAFTSQDAHYSIEKSIHWLGIGTDNLVKIKTNGRGQMMADELEKAIVEYSSRGFVPFFVNATCGTTVLGAFDDITTIATICQKYNIWLHVDACWGGSLLLSAVHKKKLASLHLSDSVSWNPHKMLGVPLQCSAFLIKRKGLLHECNCVGAKYLFQQDKFYDVTYDTGDKSIQCGRKVDAFKLWCVWKARGNKGLEHVVNNALACAAYLRDQIAAQRDAFRLVIDEFQCSNVCFWYIPEQLRGKREDGEWWNKLHRVAPLIKEKMTKRGSLMVGYTPLNSKNLKNFFRVAITCHPAPTYQDMDYIIDEIKTLGERLPDKI